MYKKLLITLLICGSVFLFTKNVLAADLVNINTADLMELDTLPGIGIVKAQAIIDYRGSNGPFAKIEDIMNVSGIGAVTYDNMKALITVGEVAEPPVETPPPPPTINLEITETEKEVLGYEAGSVVVNEFLSDAFDEQAEFVELYNNSTDSIDLTGWYIEEGSGKKSILGGTILANKFFILERPKGSLNNTGDIIKLFDATDGLIDKVVYGDWDDGSKFDNAPLADDPRVVARIYDGYDTGIDSADFAVSEVITKGASNIINLGAKYGEKNINTEEIKTATSSVKISSPSTTAETASAESMLEKLKKIIISEFIPNPAGSDDMEFIELYNPTDKEINLAGLQIDDEEGGSSPYTIGKDLKIAAQSYLVFGQWETKLALNNDEDSVRLIFEDEVIAEIEYSGASEGASYALTEAGDWQWTMTGTPGKKNTVKPPPSLAAANGSAKYSALLSVSLANIKDSEAGAKVSTEGVVAVLPDVFGAQYFYITDGSAGAQVYMHSKLFPELKVGDRIQVEGEISKPYGETRIKVAGAENIKLIGSGVLEGIFYQIAELAAEMSGTLVQVEGEITELKSTYAYIDDGTGEIKIIFKKNTGIDKADFSLGDVIKVQGIFIDKSDALQILPRSSADLAKAGMEEILAGADGADGAKSAAEKYLLATTSGLSSILVGLFLRARGFFIVRFVKRFGALVLAFVKRR